VFGPVRTYLIRQVPRASLTRKVVANLWTGSNRGPRRDFHGDDKLGRTATTPTIRGGHGRTGAVRVAGIQRFNISGDPLTYISTAHRRARGRHVMG